MGKTRTVLVEPGANNQQRILLQQPLGTQPITRHSRQVCTPSHMQQDLAARRHNPHTQLPILLHF